MASDRLGLLFLVIDGLAQAELWRRFLEGLEQGVRRRFEEGLTKYRLSGIPSIPPKP